MPSARAALRITLIASALLLALSLAAWVQAVRLPDYANYWEWRHGRYIALCHGGSLDDPHWFDTYIEVGQFPDRGAWPPPRPAEPILTSPYRWPDIHARTLRLLWPLLLSFAAPLTWLILRFRRDSTARGFPVDR
jgi:hypothetical protein